MTGVTYNVTEYSVWITTQASPAVEQRIGHIAVSVPEHLDIVHKILGTDCSALGTPETQLAAGFQTGPLAGLFQSFAPPENGIGPIIDYGAVKVLSGGELAAAAQIGAGENVTFLLPFGTYSTSLSVVLLGVPFSVSSGKFSSPRRHGYRPILSFPFQRLRLLVWPGNRGDGHRHRPGRIARKEVRP